MNIFTPLFARPALVLFAFFSLTMAWAQKGGSAQALPPDLFLMVNVTSEEQLQEAIDNSLTSPCYINITQSIVLTKQIVVRKGCNAVISGEQISVVQGYSATNIFNVASGSLSLNNITIDLAKAHSIYSCFSVAYQSKLTVGNGVVYKNVAANVARGAFYANYGGTITVNAGSLPKINAPVIKNSTGYPSNEYGKVFLKGNSFFQDAHLENEAGCEYYLDDKLTKDMSFKIYGSYNVGMAIVKSGSYQMQPSDFELMHFDYFPNETSSTTVAYDSESHSAVLTYYNQVKTVDELQLRLDAIAAKGLNDMSYETVALADDGVLVDKPLYVRNGCHAILTGGPLRLSPNVSSHYIVFIDKNSSLYPQSMNIDMMNNDFHINSGCFYVEGTLRIGNSVYDWDVDFINTPQSRGKYGDALIHIASGAVFYYLTPTKLSASGISVIKAEATASVNIWDGELESCYVPTIDGRGNVKLGSAKISGGGKGVSIINAETFFMADGIYTITDTQGGSTYITADEIIITSDENTFQGDGERIVVGKQASMSGKTCIPKLYLKKDAYVTDNKYDGNGSPVITLDGEWADFALGKTVVEKVMTEAEYGNITFLNMPADREPYYDETAQVVRLRKREANVTDNLQKFIDANAGASGVVRVDLSQFADDLERTTTLRVSTGATYNFVNGILNRAASLAAGPVVLISNGSTVEVGTDAVIRSGFYSDETIRLEGGWLKVTLGDVIGGLGYPPSGIYYTDPFQSPAVKLTTPSDHLILSNGAIYSYVECEATGAEIKLDGGMMGGMGLNNSGNSSSRSSGPRKVSFSGTRSPAIITHSDVTLNSTTSHYYSWGPLPLDGQSAQSSPGPFYLTLIGQAPMLRLQRKYTPGFEFTLYDKYDGNCIACGDNYRITSNDVNNMIVSLYYTNSNGSSSSYDPYLQLKDNRVYLRVRYNNAIESVNIDNDNTVTATYDAMGRKLTPADSGRGLQLQRMSDGTVKKIMKR